MLVFRYDHGFQWKRTDGLWWFVGGTTIYYVAGISLAVVRKDNRAFCKRLCPVTVLNRTTRRLSLLKVSGDRSSCNDCGACDQLCPMDVPVSRFVLEGRRVLDAECTLCQTCIAACPKGSLGLSLGFDVAHGEVHRRRGLLGVGSTRCNRRTKPAVAQGLGEGQGEGPHSLHHRSDVTTTARARHR